MSVRTLSIAGTNYTVPAYVHRTPEGWRISLVGFTRYWADADYGSVQQALDEAIVFLGKVIDKDPVLLKELFNATIRMTPENKMSGLGEVTWHSHEKGKTHSYFIVMKKPFPDYMANINYDFTSHELAAYVRSEHIDCIFFNWCESLSKSIRKSWRKDIVELINTRSSVQLALVGFN